MRATTTRAVLTLVALAGLTTCSGPGQNLKIDGTYLGTLLSSPRVRLTITVSGSSITAVGVVNDADNAPLWRGTPGFTEHATFTGTRDGRVIVSLTGVSNIQRNLQPAGTAIWQDANPTFSLTGSFNNNGGITGQWLGEITGGDLAGTEIGGTWSAVKQGSGAGSVTGPGH